MQRAILIQSEPYALFVLNGAQSDVNEHSIVLRDELWADAGGGNTPRMEGSHRELRSRFPDRLSSNGPDSFSLTDQIAGRQVDAVAFCANSAARFTSKRRTDANTFNSRIIDRFRLLHGEQITCSRQHLSIVAGLTDDIANRTAINTIFNRKKLFLALFNSSHVDSIQRSAIVLCDDHILSDVDKTACQISRVCRF